MMDRFFKWLTSRLLGRSREYPLRMRSRGSQSIYWAEGFGFHMQNLNEKAGERFGSILLHGRAWLSLGKLTTINPEWRLGGIKFGITVTVGGGDSGRDLSFSLSLPLLGSFYLKFEHLLPERLTPGRWMSSSLRPGEMFRMPIARSTGIRIFGGAVWISIWEEVNGWEKRAWWQSLTWTPADTFFGRTRYSERDLSVCAQTLSLPEGQYPVNVRIFESTWKRPRWPWPRRLVRAEVEPVDRQKGIPSHAGKGENGWDLEDDALFSAMLPASTPEEAVQRVATWILRDRERYGAPSTAEAAA